MKCSLIGYISNDIQKGDYGNHDNYRNLLLATKILLLRKPT